MYKQVSLSTVIEKAATILAGATRIPENAVTFSRQLPTSFEGRDGNSSSSVASSSDSLQMVATYPMSEGRLFRISDWGHGRSASGSTDGQIFKGGKPNQNDAALEWCLHYDDCGGLSNPIRIHEAWANIFCSEEHESLIRNRARELKADAKAKAKADARAYALKKSATLTNLVGVETAKLVKDALPVSKWAKAGALLAGLPTFTAEHRKQVARFCKKQQWGYLPSFCEGWRSFGPVWEVASLLNIAVEVAPSDNTTLGDLPALQRLKMAFSKKGGSKKEAKKYA